MKGLKLFAGLLTAAAFLSGFSGVSAEAAATSKDARVTGAIVNAIKDGTEPFDGDDNPGNDSGDNNRVLRSFDEAAYTLEYTMNMKPGCGASSLENATVCFEFSIPGKEGEYRWATENMGWIASSKASYENGRITLTGTTKLSPVNGANPVPGSAAMIVRLQAASVAHGSMMQPTFKLWMEGDDSQASFTAGSAQKTADGKSCAIRVSASSGYLDVYSAYANVCQWGYINTDTGYTGMKPEKGFPAAMANTGFLLCLRGDDAVKGVKGMEPPVGNIEFDLTVTGKLNGQDVEPLLWDTTTNTYADWTRAGNDELGVTKCPGHAYGRETYWYDGSWDSRGLYVAPWDGDGTSQAVNSTYDGGDFTLTKTGRGKYHVVVKDYIINGHFPRFYRDRSSGVYNYGLDVNIFSMGGYQFYIPLPNTDNGTGASFSFAISDLKSTSLSGRRMEDKVPGNNASSTSCSVNSSSVRGLSWLYRYTTDQGAGRYTWYTYDHAVLQRGTSVYCYMALSRYQNSATDYTNSYNVLYKFDDKTAEVWDDGYGSVSHEDGLKTNRAVVTGYNDAAYLKKGADYRFFGSMDPGDVRVLYAVKPDGRGWASVEEAGKTDIPDLKYYDSLDAAKAKGTVVGIMLEGRNAELSMRQHFYLTLYLKVRDDAPVGQVGWVCTAIRTWGNEDGKKMTSANSYVEGGQAVAEPQYKWCEPYTPTTYTSREEGWWYPVDGEGNLLGNPTGGRGVSFLVVDEVVAGSVGTDNGKVWYNLNQGERTVDAVAIPSISSITAAERSTDVTVVVTLGSHLKYRPGTAVVGGTYVPASGTADSMVKDGEEQEPVIGTNPKTGRTTLTWVLRGRKPKDGLPRIHYKLEIGTELDPRTDVAELDNPLSQMIQVRSTYGAESGGSSSYDPKVNLAQWGTPYCINKMDMKVNKALCTSLQLRTLQGTIDRNEDARWRTVFSNTSAVDSRPWNLYSCLPYNEDGRGSAYHGTPVLKSVVMDGQYGKASLASGVKLYVTTDARMRDGTFDARSYDSAGLSWTEVQPSVSGTTYTWNINRGDVTGIRIYGGALKSFDALNFTVALAPTEGSKGADIYWNSMSAYADRFANTLFVAPVGVQVVSRSVSGSVFNDRNKNGILDLGDKADVMVPGIAVRILDQNGNQAKDVFGKLIADCVTDKNGNYRFTELAAGTYYPVVAASSRDEKYELIKNGPAYGSDAAGNLKGNLDKDNDAGYAGTDWKISALKSWDGKAYVDNDLSFPVSSEMNPAVQEYSGCRFGCAAYWSYLTVEKVIDSGDAVAAFGPQTFTFKAEGTGWDGKKYTYYLPVTVGKDDSQVAPHNDGLPAYPEPQADIEDIPGFTSVLEGRVRYKIPSGNYVVTELRNADEEFLDFITVNGIVNGGQANMDLLVNEKGLAHARNWRMDFSKWRDSRFVANKLKK